MKKLFFGLLLGILFVFISLTYVFHKMYDDHDLSIRVKETDDSYSFYASYAKFNTGRLQHFMNKTLHTNQFASGSRLSSFITLEDNTHFYIRTQPGNLYLKLDKRSNDEQSYLRIKRLGEEIKRKLTED
jgi:hypothetical protein